MTCPACDAAYSYAGRGNTRQLVAAFDAGVRGSEFQPTDTDERAAYEHGLHFCGDPGRIQRAKKRQDSQEAAKRQVLMCYSAQISYPYKNENDEWTEMQLTTMFTAPDAGAAVDAAVRHSWNRVANLGGEGPGQYRKMYVGCIKVGEYTIGPIAADGNTTTGYGGTFFEWKCDWFGTIEQYVQSFKEKHSADH